MSVYYIILYYPLSLSFFLYSEKKYCEKWIGKTNRFFKTLKG